MIDIYCKNNKCPICNSYMKHLLKNSRSLICENNCYDVYIGPSNHWFSVFGKEFKIKPITLDKDFRFNISDQEVKELVNEVKYWKENDRYIAKILIAR